MANADVSINLCTAIDTKFSTSNDFNTSVSGKFFENEAPVGTTYPYAVYSLIAAPKEKTFAEVYTNTLMDIVIFSSNMDSSEIKNIYYHAYDLFHECDLTITGSTLVWMKNTGLMTDIQEETTPSGTRMVRAYYMDFEVRTSLD